MLDAFIQYTCLCMSSDFFPWISSLQKRSTALHLYGSQTHQSFSYIYLFRQPPKILRMHTIDQLLAIGHQLYICLCQADNKVMTPCTWCRSENHVISGRNNWCMSIWTLADYCASAIGLRCGKNNRNRYLPCFPANHGLYASSR